jgi:hypothetical protein
MESNALAVQNGQNLPVERANSLFFDVARFAHAKNVGEMLAKSTMVPDHFKNNLGNCVIALNLADRIGVDVFMMMQSMYIVHGRPGIEGKLVIALISACGRFSPLEYDIQSSDKKTAKGVSRPDSCVAFATDLKTGRVVRGPAVTWEMVEAEGWSLPKGGKDGKPPQPSKWVTLPDLMFRYRSATLFGRVHCPGAMLGLRTTEEIEDIEMIEVENGTYEKQPEAHLADAPVVNEVSTENLATAFDAAVPEGTDMVALEAFVTKYAAHTKQTAAELKADAMADQPGFWKGFSAWVKQENAKKAKAAGAEKKAEPETATDLLADRFECPNGGFVTLAICADCKSKVDGQNVFCPVYAANKK